MEIKTIKVGPLATNCYLVSDPATKEAVIIDPGFEAKKIIDSARDLKVVAILLTHGHYDHVTSAPKVAGAFSAPIWIHQNDETMMNLSNNVKADKYLKDGEKLEIGPPRRMKLEVIHTPGHSPGSICLYDGKNILFSGDTLFRDTWGRTDLPGGSEKMMQESLKKLFSLPDDVKVYPGHGPATTIRDEKKLIF